MVTSSLIGLPDTDRKEYEKNNGWKCSNAARSATKKKSGAIK